MSNQTSRRRSRLLRAASPTLWPTRLRLVQLKAAYKANAYSGHPEDMLDSIDHQESKIRRYKDGLRPLKATTPQRVAEAPSAPVVTNAHAQEHALDEATARGRRDGGPFQLGLEAAEHRLSQMRDMYDTGLYSSHPEEMLEDIEVEENRVRRLKGRPEKAPAPIPGTGAFLHGLEAWLSKGPGPAHA